MSKSRQPGKPARLAGSGRKLVSAFRPTTDPTPVEDNEFSRAAKEICYGLAVFRYIFGNEYDSQESPFHGFSPHEIRWAADKSSIRRRQVEDEHRARGVLLSPFMVGPRRNPLLPTSSLMTGSSAVQSKQIVKSEEKTKPIFKSEEKTKQVVKSEEKTKPTSKLHDVALRKKMLKSQLQRNNYAGKVGETPSDSLSPGRAAVRKFVLPVRSAHSSRVIKPNKRFRDNDGDTVSHDSSEGIRVKKIRVSVDTDEESSSSWAGKKTGESSDAESMSGCSSSTGSSVRDEDFQPRAQGKVILRKAKLKVQEPDAPAIKGPFSAGALVPQKVVCGVCGAVRYYRYINQARKFGIYSCEPCRKFISRILNTLSWSLENTDMETRDVVVCKSGTGKCFMPQYCKDPETGVNIYKNDVRCKACWLKMCLQAYRMPGDMIRSLNLWLPQFMRDNSDTIPKKSPSPKAKRSLSHNLRKYHNKQSIAKHITKRAAEAVARKDIKDDKSDSGTKLKSSALAKKIIGKIKEEVKGKKRGRPSLKLNRLRKEKVDKEDKLAKIQRKREEKLVKLQKLKGPRVKHVCRSASLVLGQPVATFTDTSPSKQKQSSSGKGVEDRAASLSSDLTRSNRNLDEAGNTSGKSSDSGSRMRQPCNDGEGSAAGKNKANLSKTLGNSDSTEEGLEGKARTLQDLSRQHYELVNGAETAGDDLGLISIHFWESYDPEEVGKNGFALIGIGEASLPRAICFICGSAGLDKVIHCACCCEPYHHYCVEAGTAGGGGGGDWWTVDWVCPRCTLCRGCGRGGGAQVACQKCHKSYHTECLAADRVASRLHSADRPWVCLSCLCCKSCNQAEVYKFVGNLPLCRVCFKLRQKGNFCPLCQRCYDENDFDTKMMECERCKCWVHAKCEGLSNEKYNILSILPDSVEFVCRMCCKMPPAPWWLAVETEMKAGFLAVLKSLSKNRKACDLLKCSPTKMTYPACTCGVGMRQRVLRFPDMSEQLDVESSDVKLQNENKNDVTVKCEEECLKSLPNFPTENRESLVCDPKSEISEKQLTLCDTRTKYSAQDSSVMKNDELQLKLDSDTISYQNADEKPSQFSPHATSQSDSGIGSTDDELKSTNDQCICLELESWNKTPLSLLTIKKKVNSNEYDSLDCFNKEMEEMMGKIQNQELLKIYHQTLEDIFPWFNPNGSEIFDSTTRVNHHTDTAKPTDAVSENKPDESVAEDVSVTLKGKLDLSSDYYYNLDKPVDNRMCTFCKQLGEGKTTEEGRLLYCGQNDWVHTNCALWSNEVFEEIDGSLQNVQSAVSRSRHIRCSHCTKKSASVGCCNRTCPEAYHFSCAKESGCVFYEDKSLFCAKHKDDCVSSRPLVTGPDFLVSRPVYVELETKKKKSVPRHDISVMIGSLTISSLGDFDPDLSDQESSIIPCNFHCTRLFWSSVEPWRLVQYSIKTKIVYTVCDSSLVEDENYTINHCLDDDYVYIRNAEDECKNNEDYGCTSNQVEEKENFFEVDENDVKETLDLILDNVCAKEEEDPQASADLLPPELKEAIFQDLPHDLLDGISMQDIFESTGLEFKPEKETKTITKNIVSIQSPGKININHEQFPNIFDSKVTLKRIDIIQKSETQPSQTTKRKLRTSSVDMKKLDKFEGKENSKKWSLSKILQIDGAGDDSSDCDSLVSEQSRSSTFSHTQHLNLKTSLEYTTVSNDINFSSSSSECSSPEREDEITWKLGQLDGATDFCSGKDKTLDEDPVKCTRCHRTYRTALSLERHLQTCNVDFLSCSESDSSEEDKASSPETKVEDVVDSKLTYPTEVSVMKPNPPVTKSENTQYQIPPEYVESKYVSVDVERLPSTYDKSTTNPPNNITQTSSQTPPSNDHYTTPHCTVVLNKLENYHTYPAKQKIIRPSFECEDSFTQVSPACGRTSPVQVRTLKRPIKTYSRKKLCTSTTMSTSAINQQKPVEYQVSNPALIIQQMPTHNVVPSYIESLQQPAVQANNIQYQYITTLDMQDKPQQIPVTVQIQPPISLQPVIGPTVLGTLIQPNGVEQLVVNTPAPTVEVMNQQPTNVFINMNQPVYMGMETVISNTVMSTSQFVSGMITGSSYSATTTQVFQTAKPVIDVPQSYVVVNTPTNPVPSTVPQTIYPPATSQPWSFNYQETYKVKERTTYQQVTRQVIQEDVECMKMVNSTQEAIIINKPVVQEVTVEKTHSIQKTLPVPRLINSFNSVPPESVSTLSDNTQYSREKLMVNNSIPVSSWNEPKIKEICDSGNAEKLTYQAASHRISPPKIQSMPAIQYENVSKNTKNINISTPENTVMRIDKIVNNSENKIGCSNGSKPIVIVRKSPVKPVISKVKANPNEKTNSCSVIYVNKPAVKPFNVEPLQNILPKDDIVSEKEPGNSLLKSVEKCLNSNNLLKPDVKKVESQKKTDCKRLPLKENKVVGNKSKPCKDNKKNTVANISHPKLMFEITSQDGVSICSQDVEEAWQKIFDAVQEGRAKKRLPPLPQNPQKCHLKLLGLDNNSVKYLLEQLPGVKSCKKYKPVYHKTKLFGHSEQLRENPTGCARTEPSTNKRRKYDMFSWLASRHRRPPKLIVSSETEIVNGISRRATNTSLPMAMRFRHLKETSKEAVGVFRSDIHGRGLFCLRDIDGGEMVIEYAGEVIRAGLTDKREHYYTAKGIGCYMFRIDDQFVVDATMHGNAARFINHSCEPNCFSKVVDILGKKHILIFALRKIVQGEELTYDYKFPLEDEKISCHCLSRKCRKYLN